VKLLVQTLRQVGAILVAVSVWVSLANHLHWGVLAWRVADIALIALGVFSLRLYQEITTAAVRASREPPDA
jgi:hypothetical protein